MGAAAKERGCSQLTRLHRRNYIHQAFFVFATARRDLVDETWPVTAREFKRRFNIGDDFEEETLVRTCSEAIRDFITDKTL